MTRIVITGACGKMGRVINDIVNTRDDCEITAGIDIAGEQYAEFPVYKKLFDLPEKPDVIIDFSHPSLLDELLDYCKINNVPVVIATTGYTDEQTRRNIQENPYLQYFCGFECYTMESPFDASMMTHFRKRISPEMIQRSTIWFLRQKQLPARIIPRKMIP